MESSHYPSGFPKIEACEDFLAKMLLCGLKS